MNTAETKRWIGAEENVQLYHNTGKTGTTYVNPILFNPWRLITQGTQEVQRIGDEIYPRGMAVNLWLSNKNDRPNILYRIFVCILPRMYNASVVAAGSIDPMITPVLGTNGNYCCLPIDTTKGIKVLYDKVLRGNTSGTNACMSNTGALNVPKEWSMFKKLWIRRKRSSKIKYTRGTQEVENKFVAVYVIPYDAYGTLTTDNIASCAYTCTLYFKDV